METVVSREGLEPYGSWDDLTTTALIPDHLLWRAGALQVKPNVSDTLMV